MWPSAVALAAAILRRPQLVAGRTVADLGAGLGLAGLAAALAGGSGRGGRGEEAVTRICGISSSCSVSSTVR